VDELWKLRDPTLPGYDSGLSELAKLLGNSTYGKFAMRQERTSIAFEQDRTDAPGKCFLCPEPVLPDTGGLCSECMGSKIATNDPDGDVYYQAHKVDAPYIIPHISSYITALSRIRLWKRMREALTLPGPLPARVEEVENGDVVFEEGRAALVVAAKPIRTLGRRRDGARWNLRFLDDGVEKEVSVGSDAIVRVGGYVYYCDTDSILTNVKIAEGKRLGEMKNEHPTRTLHYFAVQPKVYLIEDEANGMLEFARPFLQAQENPMEAHPWSKKLEKVTMKGFPPRMRTKENLAKLQAGDTLSWDQLEKVRTLARVGFRRPPTMRRDNEQRGPLREGQERMSGENTAVTKSFKSTYDKRLAYGAEGRTRAVVLDEPVGGFAEDEDFLAAAAE
jgi:hypothetical protein